MAEALDLLGRKDEARAAYARAAELCRQGSRRAPNRAPTLATLALVESKLGTQAEADQHIARAVVLGGDDAEVRYAEAVVNTRAGRPDQAIAALQAADRRRVQPFASSQGSGPDHVEESPVVRGGIGAIKGARRADMNDRVVSAVVRR